MDFDAFLILTGQNGIYQKQRCFLLCLVAIPVAFQNHLYAFIMYIPRHSCSVETVWDATEQIRKVSHLGFVNATVPDSLKEDRNSESGDPKISFDNPCSFYKISENNQKFNGTSKAFTASVVPCDKWIYDKSQFEATAVTKFNLVCERDVYRQFVLMSYFIGAGIGAFVTGYITDRFGRRKGLCLCIFLHLISGFSLAWVPNAVLYILVHLFNAFATSGMFLAAYLNGIELVGYKKRIYPAIIFFSSYSAGVLILAAVGRYLTDWRTVTISTSVPTALLLLYWWLIPESPRWLLARGFQERAHRIMGIMADTNKKEWKDIKPRYCNENDETRTETRFVKLLTQEKFKAFLIFCNWFFITSNPYQGFDISAYNGGGSHPSSRLGGVHLLDTVALIICLVFLKFRIRERKPVLLFGIMGYAAITFCRCFFSRNDRYLSFCLESEWSEMLWNVVGRLSTTMSISVLSLVTVELSPTNIRGFHLGLAFVAANLGKLAWHLAIIVQASQLMLRIASGLLASCSIFVCYLLLHVTPETCDTSLPDIIVNRTRNGFRITETEVSSIKTDGARRKESDQRSPHI